MKLIYRGKFHDMLYSNKNDCKNANITSKMFHLNTYSNVNKTLFRYFFSKIYFRCGLMPPFHTSLGGEGGEVNKKLAGWPLLPLRLTVKVGRRCFRGCWQGWEFAHRFSEQIARFCPKMSDLSDLLMIAHFL